MAFPYLFQTERKGSLFKRLVVLARSANWGHCKLKLTQIKSNAGFGFGLGKPEIPEKISGYRVKNQQTQPTFGP